MSRMCPEYFIDLSLEDKIDILYKEGRFVVNIRYYGYKVNLYLLGDLYVEVFYNHKLDCIEKVELLNPRHSRMKFYADQVRLPENILI